MGQRSPLESISELISLGPRDHTERLCWIYKQMTLERVPVTMRDHLMAETWTDPDSPDQLGDKAESLSKQLKCGDPTVASVEESPSHKSVDAVRNSSRPAGKDQKQKTLMKTWACACSTKNMEQKHTIAGCLTGAP